MTALQLTTSSGYFQCPAQIYRVLGKKADSFLHGQFTNNIKTLAPHQCNYNLWLSQKGKILADLWVHKTPDACAITLDLPTIEPVISHLKRLAPLSGCELSQNHPSTVVMHITNPEALPFVASHNSLGQCITLAHQNLSWPAWQTNRLGQWGFDVWLPQNEMTAFVEFCELQKLPQLSESEQAAIRIVNKRAKFGQDATLDYFPQEVGLDDAVSYDKGCYLGQEIMARLHFRGHVNKKLCRLVIVEQNEFALPHKLILSDQKTVTVTSQTKLAKIDGRDCLVLLACVPIDFAAPQSQIKLASGQHVLVL